MTYEYLCTGCGHQWEAEQRISEAPLTECPSCQGQTAKRQISAGAGFILKGSGWYADGYASAKSGSASKSETKADTKSETKVESKPSTDPSPKPDKPAPTKGGAQAA